MTTLASVHLWQALHRLDRSLTRRQCRVNSTAISYRLILLALAARQHAWAAYDSGNLVDARLGYLAAVRLANRATRVHIAARPR